MIPSRSGAPFKGEDAARDNPSIEVGAVISASAANLDALGRNAALLVPTESRRSQREILGRFFLIEPCLRPAETAFLKLRQHLHRAFGIRTLRKLGDI